MYPVEKEYSGASTGAFTIDTKSMSSIGCVYEKYMEGGDPC